MQIPSTDQTGLNRILGSTTKYSASGPALQRERRQLIFFARTETQRNAALKYSQTATVRPSSASEETQSRVHQQKNTAQRARLGQRSGPSRKLVRRSESRDAQQL
jgi:hypothetical protein